MNTLTTFFDWLVAAGLRASVLTLAVWIVQFILQKHLSPRWRYALWLPVLVVLLMPVLPESRWSLESVLREKPQVVEVAPTPVTAPMVYSDMPLISAAPETIRAPIDWQQISLLTWISGAALLLLIGGFSFMSALRRFQRTCQSVDAETLAQLEQVAREVGLRHPPRLLVAPTINSPAVTGLLRPVLLLPVGFERDFSEDEARLILQHELTHLKRHDLPVNTLLCVLMSLHWFNPLLWLAFFMARADREAACDAQVLENATPQRRSEYGHALLKIESAFSPLRLSLGFVGMLQRGAALRARIRSIAAPTRTRPLTGFVMMLSIACMTFLGITRAEKPSTSEPTNTTSDRIGLEIRIINFDADTDWTFDGRLGPPPAKPNEQRKDPAIQMEMLSKQGLDELLRKTLKQPGTKVTAYPRMVTSDGKKMTIRSVVNQPVLKNSESSGNTTRTAIDYLPIGFIGNFVMKALANGKVHLDLDIRNSQIIGEQRVAGNPYPIVQSLAYKAPVELPVGMSAAVYGWEEPFVKDGKLQKARPVLYVITPSRIHEAPIDSISFGTKKEAGPPQKSDLAHTTVVSSPATDANTFLANKLDHIILPRVVFKNANLEDALDFLRIKSRDLDTTTQDEKQKGVPILLRKGGKPPATITIDLKDVPLKEALNYITQLAGYQYRLTPYAVIVEQADAAKHSSDSKSATGMIGPMPKGAAIILPQVEFRDTPLADALDFIRIKSRDLDPEKCGVNIVLKGNGGGSKITLSLKNVSVSEALRYCAELTGHQLSADQNTFVLTSKSR